MDILTMDIFNMNAGWTLGESNVAIFSGTYSVTPAASSVPEPSSLIQILLITVVALVGLLRKIDRHNGPRHDVSIRTRPIRFKILRPSCFLL